MKDSVLIPPLKIQGIKTKIVPAIRENIKYGDDICWVEPFMGSGAVGFNVAPKRAIFADTNPCIIDFYRALQRGEIDPYIVRRHLESEGQKLRLYDGEYYYEVRDRFNKEKNPLDFLFLNRACFNGMVRFNRLNEFNVPYGHKPNRFTKAYVTKVVNQVACVEKSIKANDWQFLCQPFEKTIENAPENAFIYCDPPYIDRHADYYNGWDEECELRLKAALLNADKPFMLSTWDHNGYRKNQYVDDLWGFCRKVNIPHFYHVGAKEENRNPMVEALLMNYPQPAEAIAATFASRPTQLAFSDLKMTV